jgi:uncharacterized OsmC-like protein
MLSMSSSEQIKAVMARSIEAIEKRPAAGQATQSMRIEVAPNGCCSVKDGDQTMNIDLSKEYGGGGTTHSPGYYLRAALGACLAQGYYVWAAVLGVPINRLSVELYGDYDMRGNLGIDKDVPRSYKAMRYVVNIDSPAPRAAVEEVINKSDDLDWVRDAVARPIPMEREIRVTQGEHAE